MAAPSRYWFIFLLIGCCGIVSFFHLWRLATVPNGLYIDETSIGYNAVSIARSGQDEYGYRWPIYFRAFGEYKNPLFIYVAALFFWFTEPSVYMLRFVSVFFYELFLVGILLITHSLFPKHKSVFIYTILAAGFLPWFFPASRIAFEAISQLTALVYAFFFVFVSLSGRPRRRQWIFPVLAGFCFGLSIYTYSTSRLLAFIYFLTWLICYARRSTWRLSFASAGAFGIALIPYVYFALTYPHALTARFASITYIFSHQFSLLHKAALFLGHYVQYFGLPFLVIHGDYNLRHGTGFGGVMYVTVFCLALFALYAVWKGRVPRSRFLFFVLLTLVAAPIPAALTNDSYHALRTLPMGLSALLLSAYGFQAIVSLQAVRYRRILMVIVYLALIGEAALYVNDYFTAYARVSSHWFSSASAALLSSAWLHSPERIVVTPSARDWYIPLAWQAALAGSIPVVRGNLAMQSHTCYAFVPSRAKMKVDSKVRFQKIAMSSQSVRFRCYE